jgi:hypothetical protein
MEMNVLNGGSLILNNSSVSGNVQANTAKVLKLVNSSVEGDVLAGQVSSTLSLNKSMISGNLQCSTLTKLQSSMSSVEGKTTGKCR